MSLRGVIVVVLLSLIPTTGICHHKEDDLRRHVLFELKSIADQVQFARHRLERLLSTEGTLSEEIIAEAQNAYYQDRPERAALLLLDLLSRPDFSDNPGRPEAMAWLGESLVKLELSSAASDAFAEAVESPRQSVTAFEHRLERLLDVNNGTVSLKTLTSAWSRYTRLREPTHSKFSRLRYKAARSMYRSGGYESAEEIFRSVVPDDPEFVRSQYFLGVLHLRRGEIVDAGRVFDVAFESWRASRKSRGDQVVDVERVGEPREVSVSQVDEETEAQSEQRKIGFALNLSMARLAAHKGDFDTALNHYRRVPPGAAQYRAAVRETIYILSQSGEYGWAARTMAGSLPSKLGTSDDFSRAIEYARLLAKGQRYEEADKAFSRVVNQVSGTEKVVLSQSAEPSTQLKAARWLFPERTNDWQRVVTSPSDLGDEITAARAILGELSKLVDGGEELPVVQQGVRLQARIQGRITAVRRKVAELSGLVGADNQEPLIFSQSLGRLDTRLRRLKVRIQDYRNAYAKRFAGLIRAEERSLISLEAQLRQHGAAVRQHRGELDPVLRARIASHDTGAVLGQVNIAYWRKEAVSERIERLIREQRNASAPLETFPVESTDPTGPAEVSVRSSRGVRSKAGAQGDTRPDR